MKNNQLQHYAIEFLDSKNEPLPYCKVEMLINGYPVSDSPMQADEKGILLFHPSLVEQNGKELRIKVIFWNERYPKTPHSEVPEFTWVKGKKVVRLRAYNIYEITPRSIPNEKNEKATYTRPYHVVKQGDTWESIEKKTGTNRYLLLWENQLDEATPIEALVGQTLYFPRGMKKSKTMSSQNTSISQNHKPENKRTSNSKPIEDKKEKSRSNSQKAEKKQTSGSNKNKERGDILQERSENNGKPIDVATGSNKENGYYYNKNSGIFEGEIKDGDGDSNRVFACTGKIGDEYENIQHLPITHSEFRISSTVVRRETKTPGLECICIAFTARNRAKKEKNLFINYLCLDILLFLNLRK